MWAGSSWLFVGLLVMGLGMYAWDMAGALRQQFWDGAHGQRALQADTWGIFTYLIGVLVFLYLFYMVFAR